MRPHPVIFCAFGGTRTHNLNVRNVVHYPLCYEGIMRIVLNIGRITQNLMKREYSAGGIVIKDGLVLMIRNAAMKDPAKAYWGFPKGHIEKGERSEEAAIREVREETRIRVRIETKLGDSQYIFSRSGERILKSVVYYLLKYVSGEVKPQEEEVLAVKWFDPEEALELLTFKKDREFLQKALKLHGR